MVSTLPGSQGVDSTIVAGQYQQFSIEARRQSHRRRLRLELRTELSLKPLDVKSWCMLRSLWLPLSRFRPEQWAGLEQPAGTGF